VSAIRAFIKARQLYIDRFPSNQGGEVRLRITRALHGSIDGIQLDHFEPGQVYEVGTSLGSYLLSMGAAEPVTDQVGTVVIPFQKETLEDLQRSARDARDRAADRARRRRPKE
jgi:hypothetical protein